MATQTTRRVISERLVAALLTAVLIALVSFTVHALNKEKIMPQEVILELGKNGPESFKQAGAVADHRTAGEIAGFLDLRWPPKQLGVVTIRHGRHDLIIPHTFTAMGTAWPEPKGEGVIGIDLNSGISADEFIRHREAYDLWVRLMRRIQDSGWQRYIHLSAARLSGKDAIRYFQDKENFGLSQITDPQTLPEFQTWMKVVSQRGMIAYFYLDGIMMSLSFDPTISGQEGFDRYDAKLDFNEWGQYMMRISFTTARMSLREQMYLTFLEDLHGEERVAAKQDITDNLTGYWQRYRRIELAKRQNEEARLAKQGYRIDTNYRDPDLLPYLQKEPKF
ncbi:hypothetical protein [Neisseria elongata]|jgi:hypothetical protein|uniref:hypothetical protein n=1 Tax=Neisseria elongata TaxID=495 RepID=UPI000E0D2F84|nr:hypothetical protein [Neisseria elongata]